MPFHHLAITTKDLAASHRFYTEAIGFSLERVDVLETPGGGWMRHAFFDTGDGSLLALFELHDASLGDFRTDLSTGLGLPHWANHIAFSAGDLDGFEVHRRRLLASGHGCAVMDHDSAISLYVDDPNGILIELSTTIAPLVTDAHRRAAEQLLRHPSPPVTTGEPPMEFFDATDAEPPGSAIVVRARTRSHAPAVPPG
jgi:catechol 2,3-dioxygenase-like lactoylglutathione lyase family enzyme